MIGRLSVLAIIPARGGSKGIPRKNIRDLGGKPLIAWTLEAAAAARYLDRTIVSSDDRAVIEVALAFGADVPFVRPAELAQDDTPGVAPVLHALTELRGFDLVVLLQPTSPLRIAADIDAAIERLVESEAMSCVSVTESADHPYWTYQVNEAGQLKPFIELPAGSAQRRQELPRAFSLNGAVYVARVPWLLEHGTFLEPATVAYEMPPERSVDIDSIADLAAAERELQERRYRVANGLVNGI